MRTLILALSAASRFIGSVVPAAKGKPNHHRIIASCSGSGLDPDGRPCNGG